VPDAVRAASASGGLHGWGGLPGHVRRSFGPGWALVGDAGYFKDPITTHGLTDALRDAELLSAAVLGDRDGDGSAFARYQDTRDRLSRSLLDVTESVCRYDWSPDRIRTLLRQVSAAMSDELDHLVAVGRPPSPAR
jgi:flavin-dependent dehydrogenase